MTSDPTTVDAPSQPMTEPSEPVCPACGHTTAIHDAIGLRFCASTAERQLERKCLCPGEQAAAPFYIRYRLDAPDRHA
jgi:hypothetical protein